MPSFNVSLPQIPKRFDLRDVVDPIDRQLEVAEQAASLLVSTLHNLSYDSTLGTIYAGGAYPAPKYVSAGAEQTAYEAAIVAALAGAVAALEALKGVPNLQ